jgi:hypothetical protein
MPKNDNTYAKVPIVSQRPTKNDDSESESSSDESPSSSEVKNGLGYKALPEALLINNVLMAVLIVCGAWALIVLLSPWFTQGITGNAYPFVTTEASVGIRVEMPKPGSCTPNTNDYGYETLLQRAFTWIRHYPGDVYRLSPSISAGDYKEVGCNYGDDFIAFNVTSGSNATHIGATNEVLRVDGHGVHYRGLLNGIGDIGIVNGSLIMNGVIVESMLPDTYDTSKNMHQLSSSAWSQETFTQKYTSIRLGGASTTSMPTGFAPKTVSYTSDNSGTHEMAHASVHGHFTNADPTTRSNVSTLADGLSLLRNVTVQQYVNGGAYSSINTGIVQYGLQDSSTILPPAMRRTFTDPQGVQHQHHDQSKLIPILVRGIQQLDVRCETVEVKLNVLIAFLETYLNTTISV